MKTILSIAIAAALLAVPAGVSAVPTSEARIRPCDGGVQAVFDNRGFHRARTFWFSYTRIGVGKRDPHRRVPAGEVFRTRCKPVVPGTFMFVHAWNRLVLTARARA